MRVLRLLVVPMFCCLALTNACRKKENTKHASLNHEKLLGYWKISEFVSSDKKDENISFEGVTYIYHFADKEMTEISVAADNCDKERSYKINEMQVILDKTSKCQEMYFQALDLSDDTLTFKSLRGENGKFVLQRLSHKQAKAKIEGDELLSLTDLPDSIIKDLKLKRQD